MITDKNSENTAYAATVSYANTASGLDATNVQGAIDEVDSEKLTNDYSSLTSVTPTTSDLIAISQSGTVKSATAAAVVDCGLDNLIKIVFSGNISKTLTSGQNIGILGNEVIASADMPSGYTPIALLSAYSTNNNCIMFSYDASTVGSTGTFCFIKNNTTSSQNITVNYKVVFIRNVAL